MRLEWDKYFMALAKLAAIRSGCNSRPTGAVIVKGNRVISTGYNGSLPGQPQCTDKGDAYCRRRMVLLDDSGVNKYQECVSIHAEQNAINQVARCGGVKLHGAKIYCTLEPCRMCFDNIASVGISEVIFETPYESKDPQRDTFWKNRIKESGDIVVRCVVLSFDEIKAIGRVISLPTSTRRLL